jgi:hypothetical protein
MIYIGRFADKPKETIITAVLIPLLRVLLKLKGGEESEKIVGLHGKLSMLQRMCERHVERLKETTSTLDKFSRTIQQECDALKKHVKRAAADFQEDVMEEFIPKEKTTLASGSAAVAAIAAEPPVVRPVAETHLSAAVSPYADVKAAAPEVVALPPLAVGPPTIAASTAAAAPVKKHKIADDRKRLQALWTEHKVQPGKLMSKTLDTLRKGLREAGVAF